jgi:hypothetical protein
MSTLEIGRSAPLTLKLTGRFGDYITASRTPPGGLQLRQRRSRADPARGPPQVPASARQCPQDEVRNALLAPGIPAYPRPVRKRQDRPVTPEVAGSSPVGPVRKYLQIEHYVARLDTAAQHAPHARAQADSKTLKDGP